MGKRIVALVFVGAMMATAVPSVAGAGIRLHKIAYDPPGPDYQNKKSQLRAEYIVVKNTDNRRRQLRGWVIKDRAGHTYRFPRYRIPARGYVRVHTGSGRDNRGDLFWDRSRFVWDNDGDKARLRNDGTTRDTCSYAGGESPNRPKICR